MIDATDNQLRLLELKCRRPVEHMLAGEYHSVFRGQGIEFEDVRRYQPGDDVRAMDWRITAKTGEPHIKRFIEEREQFVYLLCDFSASILEDEGQRRETMAEIASLIALSAIASNDRVGLVIFTDTIELMIPPGKGRQHAHRIMEALLNFQPKGTKTDLGNVLGNFGHFARKHSIAFVISDFLSTGYLEELGSLAVRLDINAVHVMDPGGNLRQLKELIHIRDSETGESRFVDMATGPREESMQPVHLQEQMLESGINLMEIHPGENCVGALAEFFRTRQRRVADETGG